MNRAAVRPYLIRFLVVAAASLVFVVAFNEISYLTQREAYDRAPETVELVIPAGTAERVERGEAVPAIPQEMVFVLGDVLEVNNQDDVPHQLGPIWVPPGATGKLVMERSEKLAYQCSFATSRYLGLDIRQPITLGTRLTALGISFPTTAILIFLYSVLMFPVKTPEGSPAPKPAAGDGRA